MLKGKTVAVVVPAYNEEKQIGMVLETIPDFVDRIVVVDDLSDDKTVGVVIDHIRNDSKTAIPLNKIKKIEPTRYNRAEMFMKELNVRERALFVRSKIASTGREDSRIILINHSEKGGVGGSIATGYKWCKDNHIDCTAVMAGDGQMDPEELETLCLPIVDGEADYVKANRLIHRSALFVIPKLRFFGNSILSLLTKIASGYWHISDSQTGYTAISLDSLNAIRLHKIHRGFGCPNDILVKLNIAFCTIKEVPSKPVYDVGEESKMNELKVILPITFLLAKSFCERLYKKYLFRNFHPLFLLYHFAFILLIVDIPFVVRGVNAMSPGSILLLPDLIAFIFLTIVGFQSLFFAMWMDMMDNERLQK